MASDTLQKMNRWDPIQKSFAGSKAFKKISKKIRVRKRDFFEVKIHLDLSIAGEYRPRRSSVNIRPKYSRISDNSSYQQTFPKPIENRRKSNVEQDMAVLAEKIKRFERMSVSK
jgi:hypothetical protein